MKRLELQITVRPKLPAGGQVPRATPDAEYSRPHKPEPRVSLRRREEIDAAAELDRICAARPLKPPPMPADNRTRSAGACETRARDQAGDLRAMIHTSNDVQLITNDSLENKPGDFAIVRVKVGLIAGPAVQVTAAGWKLAGFSYTTKTRDTHDHVCLVYRFAGSP